MLEDISILENGHDVSLLTNQRNLFYTLMGRPIEDLDPNVLIEFAMIVARSIHKMYTTAIKDRMGIG